MKKVKSSVIIRKDLAMQFEELPLVVHYNWTAESDKMLLKYWMTRPHKDFQRVFSKNYFPVSTESLRNRYNRLKERETSTSQRSKL